jgi:hypothetical protein
MTALDIMVGFNGYEYAAYKFVNTGSYENYVSSKRKKEGPYRIRNGMTFPLNTDTPKGRIDALIFLFDNLPRDIFRYIFKMAVTDFNKQIIFFPDPPKVIYRTPYNWPCFLIYRKEVAAWQSFKNKVIGWVSFLRISEKFCRQCGEVCFPKYRPADFTCACHTRLSDPMHPGNRECHGIGPMGRAAIMFRAQSHLNRYFKGSRMGQLMGGLCYDCTAKM